MTDYGLSPFSETARERIIGYLVDGYVRGDLTLGEYEVRLDRALHVVAIRQLEELTVGIDMAQICEARHRLWQRSTWWLRNRYRLQEAAEIAFVVLLGLALVYCVYRGITCPEGAARIRTAPAESR